MSAMTSMKTPQQIQVKMSSVWSTARATATVMQSSSWSSTSLLMTVRLKQLAMILEVFPMEGCVTRIWVRVIQWW